MIFVRDGTRVHQLLMLLACVGEYPMQSVRLLGNDRVWKRRIRELQKVQDFCLPQSGERVRFRMLLVSGKGKMKTIRLHSSALPILKKVERRAYAYYMDEYDGHHFSGAVTHVGRNHRIAEVVAMCMAAGIPVLPRETRDPHTAQIRCQDVEEPCCYLGKALKLFYDDEIKKRASPGSRGRSCIRRGSTQSITPGIRPCSGGDGARKRRTSCCQISSAQVDFAMRWNLPFCLGGIIAPQP